MGCKLFSENGPEAALTLISVADKYQAPVPNISALASLIRQGKPCQNAAHFGISRMNFPEFSGSAFFSAFPNPSRGDKGAVRKRMVLANVPSLRFLVQGEHVVPSFRFSFRRNIRMYPRSSSRSGEHPPKPPFLKTTFCQPPILNRKPRISYYFPAFPWRGLLGSPSRVFGEDEVDMLDSGEISQGDTERVDRRGSNSLRTSTGFLRTSPLLKKPPARSGPPHAPLTKPLFLRTLPLFLRTLLLVLRASIHLSDSHSVSLNRQRLRFRVPGIELKNPSSPEIRKKKNTKK